MDEIAAQMKCSEATVRRAYDAMHPEVLKLALDKGKRPRRGRSIRLKPEVYAQMQRLIKQNELSNCEIARRCHCGSSTVNRERVRMTLESRSA